MINLVKEGYEAYIMFVILFSPIRYFIPNDITHQEFGMALRGAAESGVHVLAYDCKVTPETMKLNKRVKIKLGSLRKQTDNEYDD